MIDNSKIIDNFDDPIIKSDDDLLNISDIWKTVLRRRKFLILAVALSVSCSLIYSLKRKIYNPVYIGDFQLLISDPLDNSDNNALENSVFESLTAKKNDYDIPTLISYLKSPILLKEIATKYDYDPSEFASKINISQSKERGRFTNGILTVSFEAKSFNKGTNIINELSKVYIQQAYSQIKERTQSGLQFLDAQAPDTINENLRAGRELAEFQKKYSIIDPLLESKDIKKKEYNLDIEKIGLETENQQIKKLIEQIKLDKLSTEGFKLITNKLSFESKDQSLIDEFLKTREELANALSKFTPNSNTVKSLKRKIELLKPSFKKAQLNALNSALVINKNDINNIEQQKNILINNYSLQPELANEYSNLKINVELTEQKLKDLNSARQKFQLDIAQTSVPWSLIKEPTMTNYPIKPNIKYNLLISLVLGSVVGVILSLLREKLDNTFHNIDEVRSQTNSIVIGEVPYLSDLAEGRESRELIFNRLSFNKADSSKKDNFMRFFYQESMRNIYTSIRYLNTDKKIKSLMITSAVPAEGKSTINILLAKTLIELGLKVLIVDLDLRKPKIHKRLELNNFRGFSNIITDDTLEIKSVIQKIDSVDNLDVITSGIIPPNPTLLLSSQRMKLINSELNKMNYDYIIYDVPPIQGLSDAVLIGENVDGVILLASLDNTKKNIIKDTLKNIEDKKLNFLGIITNRTNEKETFDGGMYGYSNYGYGYTYSGYYNPLNKDDNEEVQENNKKINKFSKLINFFNTKKNKFIKWIDN